MGVGLDEEGPGLLLDGLNCIGAGHKAQRRLVLIGKMDQGIGELCGVASLLAVHCPSTQHGLLGALGVVVDRGLGILGGLRREQFGTEDARLDDRSDIHRAYIAREGAMEGERTRNDEKREPSLIGP